MNLEWIAEDEGNTLAHTTKLKLDNIESISPTHALLKRDLEIANNIGVQNGLKNTNIIVAGESLAYQTFNGVGQDSSITDALFKRIKSKLIGNKINIVHLRIPQSHKVNGREILVNRISEIQASGLVGVQLEADASVVIPPLNSGLSSLSAFNTVYERTKVEIQTFRKEKDIVGYIPTTRELGLVSEMIKSYIKDGIRLFAVDFSSSPLNRWLIRTMVTAIRTNLKIKGRAGEKTDKHYYLHVLNVAPNKKTPLEIAPMMDILSHAYGVDSTSGVTWGGGKLIKEKMRYYHFGDYGAYQIGILDKTNINPEKSLISGRTNEVYEKLRTHRLIGYKRECENISQTLGENKVAQHLSSKSKVHKEVRDIFMDINEIIARSS